MEGSGDTVLSVGVCGLPVGGYSPRLCFASRPSLPQAGKRVIFLREPNPLSAEGEERVIQRSADRVSKRRAFINEKPPKIMIQIDPKNLIQPIKTGLVVIN
jgi:hypothetical protein